VKASKAKAEKKALLLLGGICFRECMGRHPTHATCPPLVFRRG
jgi:hypothetical protein